MSAISLLDFVNQTQEDKRAGLVMKVTNESIFLRILRFIPINGFTYEYSEQTTLGGIAFRALNEQYSPDTGLINPRIESTGVLGGQINTDHQLVIKQGGIARANAIAAKLRKAGLIFDKTVIDGDPTANLKEFYGLNSRITGNQLIYAGNNGGALTLDLVDQLIDAVVGPNEKKVLIMNKADRRKLKQLVVASAGGAAVMDVGKSLDSYDNVKIEVIDEDGDEAPILAKDETRGSSSVTSSMYCIRPGSDVQGEFMQGIVGSNMIEHYESGMNGNLHVDVVEMNAGIALFHGRSAARLAGIL